MSEAKFTKGPWVARYREPSSESQHLRTYIIDKPDGWTEIAKVNVSVNPLSDWYAPAYSLEANAHLIAAAPELYEALEAAANSSGFQYMFYETREKINAALAKARGEV